MRAAVISNGKVINTIVLPDGWPNVPNAWPVPEGCEVVISNEAAIGDDYDGQSFNRLNKEGTPITIQGLLDKTNLTNEELILLVKDLYSKQPK